MLYNALIVCWFNPEYFWAQIRFDVFMISAENLLKPACFLFHQKEESLYINYLFFSKIHLPYLRHLSVSVRYMMKEQDILSYKLTSLFIYSFFQADFFYSTLCKYSLLWGFFLSHTTTFHMNSSSNQLSYNFYFRPFDTNKN